MKVQVFILLGLMCYSAFSTCTTPIDSTGLDIGGDKYIVGKLVEDCCLQKGTGAGAIIGITGGKCNPKNYFVIDSKLWVVAEVDKDAKPIGTVITAGEVAGTDLALVIFQVNLATPASTNVGTYINARTAADAWTSIAVTASAKCSTTSTLLKLTVTPGGTGGAVTDWTKKANPTITAAGSFIAYETSTQRYKGYASTADPCSETFAKTTTISSVTANSVEYSIGTKGNECCVQGGTTSLYCFNDVNLPGTCTPLDIAFDSASNEVWVALKVSANAELLTPENANGATTHDFTKTLISGAAVVDNSVLIARISTTTGTDFGKFAFAAYVAPKSTSNAYTTFTFTDLRACTFQSVKYVQVEGDLGTSTWTDEAGAAIAAATGKGAFLVINPATGDYQGFASTGRICSGASILSIASAILAFVGLVAL